MSEGVESSEVKNGNGSAQASAPTPQVHLSPNQRAWRRFRRNRPAVISSWFLALLLILVIAWPVILGIANHAGASGKAFALSHDPDTLSNDQFQPPSAA